MISLKLFATLIIVLVYINKNAQIVQTSPVSGFPNIGYFDLEEDSPLSKRLDSRTALRDLDQLRDLLSSFRQKKRMREVMHHFDKDFAFLEYFLISINYYFDIIAF